MGIMPSAHAASGLHAQAGEGGTLISCPHVRKESDEVTCPSYYPRVSY